MPKTDIQPALQVATSQPDQLRHEFVVSLPDVTPSAIVVAGMGGSALAADFIRKWLGDKLPVPLVTTRDYSLPGFVGKSTLVIISSYSGNTEETLACLEDAMARKATVVIMSAGGRLQQLSEEHHLPFVELPGGLQPRMAVLYGVRALAGLLEALELSSGAVSELREAADWLDQNLPHQEAEELATVIHGKIPVVYAGPVLGMQAYKWKIDFNENAKNAAYYCLWPEFNHNEILGWANPDKQPLIPIELRSTFDHPRISKRFEVTNRLLADGMPAPVIVQATGGSRLEQMLWVQLLGDCVSIHLGGLNDVDPVAVPLIEELKKELDK